MILRENHKPSYQCWYEDDFAADSQVQLLTDEQRWMYRQLCQKAFVCSTRPYLPVDKNELRILAGCSDRKMWDKAYKGVLALFDSRHPNDAMLVSRKRIVEDWEQLTARRESLAARGKLRWSKGSEVSKVKGSKGSKVYSSTLAEPSLAIAEPEEEMAITRKISDSCLQILGIQAYGLTQLGDVNGTALKQAARIYGEQEVLNTFETWAETQKGTVDPYIISKFIRLMDGLLRGISTVAENPDLKPLGATLYEIGNQVFTNQQLAGLLASHKRDEIEAAYQEFIYGLDEYQLKFAVRDFCNGGADAIITARQKREAIRKEQEQFAITAQKQQADEAEAELDRIHNEQKEALEALEEL